MDMATPVAVIRQHLIDPEICIRCNTCEATCPIGAITHDDRNYVVNADVCNGCMACISPCPTGSIDNWRHVTSTRAYSVEEQLGWDDLPAEWSAPQWAEAGLAAPQGDVPVVALNDLAAVAAAAATVVGAVAPAAPPAAVAPAAPEAAFNSAAFGATLPPWSAAHAYTNLYPPKSPTTATVVGNFNCTEAGFDSETHHVVLDFGSVPFPVLEGQSIAIIPPGTDASGRATTPASTASPARATASGRATTTSPSPSNAWWPTTLASRCAAWRPTTSAT